MTRRRYHIWSTLALTLSVLAAGSRVWASRPAELTGTAIQSNNSASGPTEVILDIKKLSAAPAASSAGYELWYTFGDGGQTGTSAKYTLGYTTGQATVGKGSGGGYELQRGFWQAFSTSCCQGKRGNLNLTGIVDISDLCILVSFLTGAESALKCYDEANVTVTGIVDLADLSALISYLAGGDFVLPYCR